MEANLGHTFTSFVDHLVYTAQHQTLLIVFDASGAQHLQPTRTNSSHRSSPKYLHSSKLVDVVNISDLSVLMVIATKIAMDGHIQVGKEIKRIAIWGLMSTQADNPRLSLTLSRLSKTNESVKVIIGDNKDNVDSVQVNRKLSKWCVIVAS